MPANDAFPGFPKDLFLFLQALASNNNRDWEERAVERETDEGLESMGISGQQEIAAIGKALERIEDGSYGVCVRCGDDISSERLDVLPFTPVCRNCAAGK